MATKTSKNLALGWANNTLNWATDDIRVLLVNASCTLDENSDFLSSAVLGEVSGPGYVRVGLSGRSADSTPVGDIVRLLASNPFWGTMSPSTALTQAIVYKHVSSDADSLPLVFVELGTVTVTADTYQIMWPGTGVTFLRFGEQP